LDAALPGSIGTPDALLHAANFVQIVESRQGLKIACLEEVALNLRISTRPVWRAGGRRNTEYGQYLLAPFGRDRNDVVA
jgi:glucose-1-phosphate thymidylyltransferase